MAQITMDKKALAILGMILAFLGLALFAAGLFSGLLLREAGSRPDAAALERQLAEVSSRLEEASRRAPAPAPAPEPAKPEPAPAPAPEPAKPEPAKPEPAKPEPAKPEPAKAESAKAAPALPVLPPPIPVRPVPSAGAGYVIQTGAFTVKMNAVNQAERLKEKGHSPAVVEVKGKNERIWFVVRLLGFVSMEEAQKAAQDLLERDGIKAVAMEADFPMSPFHEEISEAEAEAEASAPRQAAPAPAAARQAAPAPAAARQAAPAPAPAAAAEPAPPPSGETRHSVQVSSFREEKDANTTVRMLKNRGYSPCIVTLYDSQDKPWYVVQIGDFAVLDEANQAGAAYKASGGGSYVVKSYDDSLLAQRRSCP